MSINTGRSKILYNSLNPTTKLVYQLEVDNEAQTPASATLDIYAPGNSTALVDDGAMTVSGTTLTYAPDTTTVASWPIATGYRAELSITYSGAVYTRTMMFDVVRFILHTAVTSETLLAIDDALQGQAHNADSDFSPLIEVMFDVLQARIETKLIEDDLLNTSMILDASKTSLVHSYMCLQQFWANKGDEERRDYYKDMIDLIWPAILGGTQYDKDQDGEEDATIGGVQVARFVT